MRAYSYICRLLLAVLPVAFLFTVAAQAETEREVARKFLEQTPFEPLEDPYFSTSALFIEIQNAVARLRLGSEAFSRQSRAETITSLVSDDVFLAAFSRLLEQADNLQSCDRATDANSLPQACVSFPDRSLPAFPQTLSFPGQTGRVNSYGFFVEYDKAPFVKHHYGESVALLDGNRRLLCSALLLDEATLLTAAHCACEPALEMAFLGRSIDAMDRTSVTQSRVLRPGAQFYDEDYCDVLGGAKPTSSKQLVDIAILNLRRPFIIAEGFQKIDLRRMIEKTDMGELLSDDRTFFLSAGFGDTDISDRGGTNSVVIQNQISLCSAASASKYLCLPEFEFVSTLEGVPVSLQTDTCNGDSGGPLVLSNPDIDDQLMPIGVIARGVGNGSERCGRGGIFTSLLNDEVQRWISQKMKWE